MKKLTSTIALLALITLSCGNPETSAQTGSNDASGVDWVPLHTALEKAQTDGKKILIDVYTVWCGYCRRMNTETYADNTVKETIDKYFYPVRLNAESNVFVEFAGEVITEQELALAFGVRGYPTTVILNYDGSAVGRQPGFMDARDFNNLLSFVGSDAYKNTQFDDYLKEQEGEQ
jgi:thioredoxin-related protein